MNPKIKRFAPLGLYLALIAAIAAVVIFILQREWNLYLEAALGLVIVGLGAATILDPDSLRKGLTGRQAKYGSNSLVLLLAVLGILVVINLFVFENNKRWDLTEDKTHTLSAETINVLQSLPEKVTAEAFFTAQSSTDSVKAVLEDFKANSNGNFDYEFINPNEEPIAANEAGITKDATVVIKMGDKLATAASNDEEGLANALVRIQNSSNAVVYFLQGHGESDPLGTGDTSYAKAAAGLQAKNYTVKDLDLLTEQAIPADAAAIVIAGPLKPVSDTEIQLINDYLSKGGSLIALVEPRVVSELQTGEADPLVDYLQQTWGVTVSDNLIIDPSLQQGTIAVGQEYSAHAIVQNLASQNMYTLFYTARGISVSSDNAFNPDILISTSSRAWGETDMDALINNNEANEDDTTGDTAGPMNLAVALEDSTTGARIVVVGDSEFATDSMYDSYGNSEFFLNSVEWAAKQENLISLTTTTTTDRMMITPDSMTINLVFLGSVIVLPLLVLGAGIFTWISRRRRG